ncbi:hypothetical protein TNCV_2842071 [Trichonephila clavipes]|uniref:Uncharacterized protein n=1 Tax=Trichonephila clavipes TaxID=2585209 RepID=A0A8X6RZ65_TRICX|nr:hypothetical protein TNCV_2842071 [Trichonephila clavipes]
MGKQRRSRPKVVKKTSRKERRSKGCGREFQYHPKLLYRVQNQCGDANATVQQLLTTVSPNSNPTIVMLQTEAGFISKHNIIPFRCSCPPFITPLAAPVDSSQENDGPIYLLKTTTSPLNLTPISEAVVEVPKTLPKEESGDGSSAGNSARIQGYSITEEEAALILLQLRNKNFDPDESHRGEEIAVSPIMLTVARILLELQYYEI